MCWIYINYAYTNLIVDVRCIRKMKEKERYTHTHAQKPTDVCFLYAVTFLALLSLYNV